MKNRLQNIVVALSYLRLSEEDTKHGESTSITNQRRIIGDYCAANGITLVGEFVDDGWSGGNFDRPGFQEMMRELQKGKANLVITKDLSRLGRDMREASYYAEQFFPEHNIRYIAIADNFDTEQENVLAPFQFAMNEVYLRDGSKKIRQVLKNKRENGLYYACPPYGYKKSPKNNNLLVPDENTACIVQRIFERAARGDSSIKIAQDLNADNIIPPLKYRVLYRDNFSDKGAMRASDFWSRITVSRILKNRVYLGHTVLGKTKKASIKSKRKIFLPEDDWVVTQNTHKPLVTEEIFSLAQKCLGKNTKRYLDYGQVRKSIFSGLIFCAKCGHALCSCGSVYNGEREKYWYLQCTQRRKDTLYPCCGSRIRYSDLVDIITTDINKFLALNSSDIKKISQSVMNEVIGAGAIEKNKAEIQKATARINVISRIIPKLYTDNAEGKISDEQFSDMLIALRKEDTELHQKIEKLNKANNIDVINDNLKKFFDIVKKHSQIKTLDRSTLLAFVDRIEIGEKEYLTEVIRDTHNNKPFRQEIKIYYKFIGNMLGENTSEFDRNKDV